MSMPTSMAAHTNPTSASFSFGVILSSFPLCDCMRVVYAMMMMMAN